MAATWGYKATNGPSEWHREFPVATEGKRQSPINIETDCVVDSLAHGFENPLTWGYTTKHCLNVENTGSSWKVNVDGTGSTLAGGPLWADHDYELWQFHAHWGSDDTCGSEHTIDGHSYAGELHMVHWNRKYASPNVAAGEPDGLVVLGLFIEVGDEHPEFAKLIQYLNKIKYSGQKVAIGDPIDPANFLPSKQSTKKFWTYEGSLTTPPLLESVIWIVFQKPIQVSQEQLTAMRKLHFTGKDDENKSFMVDNFRPPLPLGSRVVREM